MQNTILNQSSRELFILHNEMHLWSIKYCMLTNSCLKWQWTSGLLICHFMWGQQSFYLKWLFQVMHSITKSTQNYIVWLLITLKSNCVIQEIYNLSNDECINIHVLYWFFIQCWLIKNFKANLMFPYWKYT